MPSHDYNWDSYISQTSYSNGERADALHGVELDKEMLDSLRKQLDQVVDRIKEATFNDAELAVNMECFIDNLENCISEDFHGTAYKLLDCAETEILNSD